MYEAKEFVDDQPQGRFGRLLIMVTSNLVSNLQFCTIPILSNFKTFIIVKYFSRYYYCFFLKSTFQENHFNLCGKKLKITAQCQSYAFLHGKYESGRVWIKYKTTLKFDIVWTKVFRRKWNIKNEINLILNCAIVFVVALFFCIINYYNFFARKMMTRRGDKIALSLAAFIFFPAL